MYTYSILLLIYRYSTGIHDNNNNETQQQQEEKEEAASPQYILGNINVIVIINIIIINMYHR